MPFCSATCAIAVLWPESKAPTSSWAPSLISFSARERATSTLVSVSAFMIASSGRPSSLKIAGATSAPRLQSCPMLACAPEVGSSRPTFSGALWARTMLKGAVPASSAAAPAPAAKPRRLMPARADVIDGRRVIDGPPGMPDEGGASGPRTLISLIRLLFNPRCNGPLLGPFVAGAAETAFARCGDALSVVSKEIADQDNRCRQQQYLRL